ncbi:DNA-binding MarR family transcriptional regulator [Tamaricihabitans halophyticus]|uniref:DNA-binding MarR family transcriptional regulator n=1 Tax=Tamaricihabitans halophyticus TaxID=1262583 RepID=A0A4R2QYE1_9PSEU|nr:MarR family transcriptional regulator [Tamaricihabitans halophyticus]TCP55262.1 DNA-binding MarR family transcriptional regulator [Tamaricihabitans halophyticus]
MAERGVVTEVSLTAALTRAAHEVASSVQRAVKDEGFSFDQWLVIESLAGSHGMAMAELAANTKVTGPTLTRVVDRLVTTATVYREVDATDRRRVLVYLSPRGRAVYRRLAPKVAELESELLERIPEPAVVLSGLRSLHSTEAPAE